MAKGKSWPTKGGRVSPQMVESMAADWLTKKEAAAVLKVTTRTINRYVEKGMLNPSRITDQKILFRASEVERVREGLGTSAGAGAKGGLR